MNYEIIDTLFRSRNTILKHLQTYGYDITPYVKFSQKEILEMLKGGEKAFRMDLVRSEEDAAKHGGPVNCRVLYSIARLKLKLANFVAKLTAPLDEDMEDKIDPETTEVIVITLEPIGTGFHVAALSQYTQHKLRLRFFEAKAIETNPLEHFLVPPHERVQPSEVPDLLKKLRATSRSKFPLIRFHEDPIARLLGLLPGDLVKITRPSPTSLEYEPYYRVCVP